MHLFVDIYLGLQCNGAAKDVLGPTYAARLKQLLLRQKLKEFFVDSDLEQTIATQRENLFEVAPILKKFTRTKKPMSPGKKTSPPYTHRKSKNKVLPVDSPTCPVKPPLHNSQSSHSPSSSSPQGKLSAISSAVNSPMRMQSLHNSSSSGASGSGSSNSFEKIREFNLKLNQLKAVVINWVHKVKSSFQSSNSRLHSCNSLDYESFARILLECGLEELAKPDIFSIFDITKCGEIKLRDFLLTLQAFKPLHDTYDEEGRLDSARFYFRLFDINETGSIDYEDLQIVVSCLILNDLPVVPASIPVNNWPTPPPSPMSPQSSLPPGTSSPSGTRIDRLSTNETSDSVTPQSLSDLFSLINLSSNGRIDFDEFRVFYDAILAYTTTRQSLVSYETEAARKVDQAILEDQFRCFGFDF